MIIETNDTDISKLFFWSNKFSITDRYGIPVSDVYMRLVGDAELNRARVKAIRASKELRNKLKDRDSDERVVFIPELDEYPQEALVEMVLIQKVKEFTQSSMKEVIIPVPVEPSSEASLEKQEKYQEEIDNFDKNRQDKIKELTTKKIDNYRKAISSNSVESLIKEYESLLINDLCENEMIRMFRLWCVYFGCFKEETHRNYYFSSFDELDNLPTEIKEQFINNYQLLEINIENLKKSLEATH